MTIQQVFKEKKNGQLVWNWAVIIDGIERQKITNNHARQLSNMRLQGGAGTFFPGCVAKVENLHHEMLDLGRICIGLLKAVMTFFRCQILLQT